MGKLDKVFIGCIAGLAGGCVILALGCLVAFSVFFIFNDTGVTTQTSATTAPGIENTITPETVTEVPSDLTDISSDAGNETLRTLQNSIVPVVDLRGLGNRLGIYTDDGNTALPEPEALQVGTRQTFWAANDDTDIEVHAILRAVTDHAYFWVEDGLSYSQSDLNALATTFEDKIYPTDREFFGSEWSPGVDNDVHLYILYARDMGSDVAGYFSSNHEYTTDIVEHSNAHEMFMINADTTGLDEEYTYGVLAHEFQHMIHWYRDRNEESWLNEGFSDLATFLNGYDTGGFDYSYISDPDLQLNDWPETGDTGPHYGSSFLYVAYLLDRFGEDVTKAVVESPQNGFQSIDSVLRDQEIKDDATGEYVTADDVFQDWTIANLLHDGTVADGRYTYNNYPSSPQVRVRGADLTCSAEWTKTTVRQYGVDYIPLSCTGSGTLEFEGNPQVELLPEDPHSGQYYFWSNKGDESDMTLTQTFDLTSVSGAVSLDYWTWYDIEDDFDYLYLMVSEDGQSWTILNTPTCTSTDPNGQNYGCGYSNQSHKWIEESIDLSAYAGKQIQLRFEYITDGAVNGEGFVLDDVSIPEIGYSTDFETDDGGWISEGFVRVQNQLPQTYAITLVKRGSDTTVEKLQLDENGYGSYSIDFGDGSGEVILIVSGTARNTRQLAGYRYRIMQ